MHSESSFSDAIDELQNQGKPSELLSTYLDVPLRNTVVYKALKRGRFKRSPAARELDEINHLEGTNLIFDHENLSRCNLDLLLQMKNLEISQHHHHLFEDLLSNAIYHTQTQLDSLSTAIEDSEDIQLNNIKNHPDLPTAKSLFFLKEILSEGVIATARKWSKNTSSDLWVKKGKIMVCNRIPNFRIYLGNQICVIITPYDKYIASRDHFLCLADIFNQRSNSYLACLFADTLNSPVYPSPDKILEIFLWGDKVLSEFGNDGFHLISKWEALCTGILLRSENDPLTDNAAYLNNIRNDVLDKFPEFEAHLEDALTLLRYFVNESTHQLIQVYGLYRIWGHPTIDGLQSISELRKTSGVPRVPNFLLIEKVTNLFKQEFCMAYYSKHHKWPKLNYKQLSKKTVLHDALIHNLPLNILDKRYKLDHWSLVEAEQTFNVAPKFNLVELISDKSLSLPLDELIYELTSTGTIGNSVERTVLVNWLKNNAIDAKDFLKKINDHGFSANQKCYGVHPKEREMKVLARLFGLMPPEKRMYIVLTEALISEYILPYFPQITMMDSALDLTKKFFNITGIRSQVEGYSVFTNLDFMKWNTNMREEETRGIFKFIDNLLGFDNLIQRTHEMWFGSFGYLSDPVYRPTPNTNRNGLREDEGCWTFHLGGIEGLRQKGWTVFTVILILLAAEGIPCKITIMGQGDNQVLKFTFPPHLSEEQARMYHEEFLAQLNILLSKIGPPLKLEESWSSSIFFTYGKFPIFNGVPQVMSLKRLCRIFKTSNEKLPTLETILSTMGANLSAAAASDTSPLISYMLYSFEALNAIQHTMRKHLITGDNLLKEAIEKLTAVSVENTFTNNKRTSKLVYRDYTLKQDLKKRLLNNDINTLRSFMIFPRCLGGYPIVLLGELFTRGFPDPVTMNIGLLKKLHDHYDLQEQIVNILSPIINETKNPALLFEDPVSLNLYHPSTPSERIRVMISKYLASASWIKNQEFRTFMNIAESRQDPLTELLFTMRPLNPRIGYEIVHSTVVGRAKHVVGQVNKTGTLLKMTTNEEGNNFFTFVGKTELNYLRTAIYQLNNRGIHEWNINTCSTEHANKLRKECWDESISGVTVAWPLEYLILEKYKGRSCNLDHVNGEGYLHIQFAYAPITQDDSLYDQLGPFYPYVGSKTTEKSSKLSRQIINESSPLLKGIAHLALLIGWGTDSDSNLSTLIKQLFESITDLDFNEFLPILGEVSGSVEHRWMDKSLTHGGTAACLYNAFTRVQLSSDTLRQYSKGSVNWNLHFQSLYTCTLGLISHLLSFHLLPSYSESTYHGHIICDSCIIPINESKIDLEKIPGPLFSQFKDNPYCWIPKENLSVFLEDIKLPEDLVLASSVSVDRFDVDYELACHVGHEILKITDQLNYRTKESLSSLFLPHSFSKKIDPDKFFPYLILYMANSYLIRYSKFKISPNVESILSNVIKYIESLPKVCWNYLSNLVFNRRVILYASKPEISIKIPSGTPYQMHSSSEFIANIVLSTCDHLRNNPENIDFILPRAYILKTNVLDNQYLHKITAQILSYFTSLQDKIIFINMHKLGRLCLSHYPHEKLGMVTRLSHLTRWVFNCSSTLSRKEVINLIPGGKIDVNQLIKRMGATESNYSIQIVYYSIESLIKIAADPPIITELRNELPFILPTIKASTRLYKKNIKVSSSPGLYPFKNVGSNRLIKGIGSIESDKVDSPYLTSSVFKFASILTNLSPNLLNSRITAIVLGDGQGGITEVICRLNQNNKVYFNTFLDPNNAILGSLPHSLPANIAYNKKIQEQIVNLEYWMDGITDVANTSYPNTIQQNQDFSYNALCSDVDGSIWDSDIEILQYINNLGQILNEHPITFCIIKIRLNRPGVNFILTSILYIFFDTIEIIKSHFSKSQSNDSYLIATGRRIISGHIVISYPTQFLNIGNLCSWRKSNVMLITGNCIVSELFTKLIEFNKNEIPVELPPHVVDVYRRMYGYLVGETHLNKEMRLQLQVDLSSLVLFPKILLDTFHSRAAGHIKTKKRGIQVPLHLNFQSLRKWAMTWLTLWMASDIKRTQRELNYYHDSGCIIVYATQGKRRGFLVLPYTPRFSNNYGIYIKPLRDIMQFFHYQKVKNWSEKLLKSSEIIVVDQLLPGYLCPLSKDSKEHQDYLREQNQEVSQTTSDSSSQELAHNILIKKKFFVSSSYLPLNIDLLRTLFRHNLSIRKNRHTHGIYHSVLTAGGERPRHKTLIDKMTATIPRKFKNTQTQTRTLSTRLKKVSIPQVPKPPFKPAGVIRK